MNDTISSIVETLKDRFGKDLRGVGMVRNNEYRVLYIRDDIEPRYSGDKIDHIGRDLVLESLRKDPLEDLYVAGEKYEFSSIGFDRMVILQFVLDGDQWLVLSLERDCFDDINSIVETVQDLPAGDNYIDETD